LISWLGRNFKNLEFENCLDLFGGTGVVSYLLKALNKKVTFNDYLLSNCFSARALIENNNKTLTKGKINDLFNGPHELDFITKTFKGIYFPESENKLIDDIIYRISYDPEKSLSGFEEYLAYHCLFQALLMKRPFNLFHRANLSIRANNVERTFGNKITWERSFSELMERIRLETNDAIFNNGESHKILNLDALDVKPGYDLVYLDPPYYSSSRRSYIDYYRYYHFLEGICSYDKWKERIDFSLKELPITNTSCSFKTGRFKEDLASIMEIHRESIIVISYKSHGYPTIDEIKDLMSLTHKKPRKRSISHIYRLNKNNGHYRENLLVAEPNQ